MRMRNENIRDIEVVRIIQHFSTTKIAQLDLVINQELKKLENRIKPGNSIALAVGSRGISNIDKIVKETVKYIKSKDAHSFIVPAMGSHGGATANGQKEVLARYNITEESMGCPVNSTMEVTEMEQKGSPIPVYMDKYAYEADGVILINRIKPHTNFHASYESGLVKMSTIGLGKHTQAFVIHTHGTKGMVGYMPKVAKEVLNSGKILGGLAIVENAYDETMHIEVVVKEDIFDREPTLLQMARDNMPKLPVKDIDVLIVDRIGKNISGVGMDPNIIGRIRIPDQVDPEYPAINSIYIRDLTPETHGNAIGMGLGDVISKKLYNKIDYEVTYENVYTSGNYERVKIPVLANTDEEAIAYALRQNRQTAPQEAVIVWIKDTLHLQHMYVSQALLNKITNKKGIEKTGNSIKLLDNNGQMCNFESFN